VVPLVQPGVKVAYARSKINGRRLGGWKGCVNARAKLDHCRFLAGLFGRTILVPYDRTCYQRGSHRTNRQSNVRRAPPRVAAPDRSNRGAGEVVVGGGGIFRDNIMKLTAFSGTVQVYNHSAVSCTHYPLLSVLPALRYRYVLLFFFSFKFSFFQRPRSICSRQKWDVVPLAGRQLYAESTKARLAYHSLRWRKRCYRSSEMPAV